MKLEEILTKSCSAEELLGSVRHRLNRHWSENNESLETTAEIVRRYFPEKVQDIQREADEIREGFLILPGTGAKPHYIGKPPKWNDNPFHDNEYVWVLNRLEFLKPLLEAYLFTKDEKYCDEVFAIWENWIDSCECPTVEDLIKNGNGGRPVSPWRTLEAGIRMFSTWPFLLRILITHPKMTPVLFEKILINVHKHGEILDEVCRFYWPNAAHNHYLMEMLGLLTLACYFPELKKARSWREYALHELERCAKAQLMLDGAQIEGCPGYHNECIYFFYLAAERAKSFGLELSEEYMRRFQKAADYSLYSFRPSGTQVPLGDSFDGLGSIGSLIYDYLFFGDKRKINAMRNYVSDQVIAGIAGEMIWSLDSGAKMEKFLQGACMTGDACDLPLVNFQQELDQIMMRTSWEKDGLSLLFACHTPIENLHTHVDPMSFDFTALGKNIIADPGVFCYRDDDQRMKYKTAKWHNVLLIHDKEPFEYISSWVYGPQKEGRITAHGVTGSIMFAEAMHINYEPAIHRRFIAVVEKSYLVVLDKVENLSPADTVGLYYHFDSTCLEKTAENRFVCSIQEEKGPITVGCVFSDHLQGVVLDGTISDGLDMERPSKRLYLQDGSQGEKRLFVSVFYPQRAEKAPDIAIGDFLYEDGFVTMDLLIDGRNCNYAIRFDAL